MKEKHMGFISNFHEVVSFVLVHRVLFPVKFFLRAANHCKKDQNFCLLNL